MSGKVQAKTMLLEIDPLGGTAYDQVVCLLTLSKQDTISEIDAASYCGPDSSPGELSISYSATAQHFQDPVSGEISGTSLRILARAKTTLGFRISPLVPVTGDEVEYGTMYISEIGSEYSADTVGTFSLTMRPFGTPTLVEQS